MTALEKLGIECMLNDELLDFALGKDLTHLSGECLDYGKKILRERLYHVGFTTYYTGRTERGPSAVADDDICDYKRELKLLGVD